MRKGEGRGGDGGVKMFRSSSKNLEGGAASVITSSIFPNLSLTSMLLFFSGFAFYCLKVTSLP